jgi:hypothetical protein
MFHLRRVKRVTGAEFELQLEILSFVQRTGGSLDIDYPSAIIFQVNIDSLSHAYLLLDEVIEFSHAPSQILHCLFIVDEHPGRGFRLHQFQLPLKPPL